VHTIGSPAHVERGVDHHRAAGLAVELGEQVVELGVLIAADRLDCAPTRRRG
jgi:hypothetical protein